MIAVDVKDLGRFPVLAKDFLNDRVGLVTPTPLSFELPSINDIAHQVKIPAIIFPKKVEKGACPCMLAAKVDV